VSATPHPTLPHKGGGKREAGPFLLPPPRWGRVGVGVWFAALSITIALTPPPAHAEDAYPNKPIRLVIGFGAGGPTDIPARFVADRLSEALSERVIVENKTGAGGMLATRDVLSRRPDGYNLLLCTHFEAINIAAYRNPGFTLDDLAPISLIAKYYYGLALANNIPATDFKSFVAYAKAHPGEVSYATIGVGSAQEILARQLEKLTGISMIQVPFRGGPQVVQELVAERVHFYVSPTLAIMPQYHDKQLKILATTSPERLGASPEIPTLSEIGINFVRFGWLGICGAQGTPPPIVDLLNQKIAAIVASPAYRTMIENAGSVAVASTPAELGKVMRATLDEVAPTIREFGLQQD
jgi:tripartite-type tricarboxylate transporter receptor subunit TctC